MTEFQADPWSDAAFRPRLELDVICRDFERTRRAQSNTEIETFLETVPAALRRNLAEELVAIECELRRSAGDTPSIADYQQRFPELSDVLDEIVSTEPSESVPVRIPDLRSLNEQIKSLGEFQIRREIGRGGMGVVYEATQQSLGRRVALKILCHLGQLRDDARDRFLRESKILASLQHPHIVQAYAAGEQDGVLYLAMQFVNGRNLAQVFVDSLDPAASPQAGLATSKLDQITAALVRRDPDWFRLLAGIGADIADALEHAHQHGILHRDVKPSNVILDTAGRSYLTDFGLAKLLNDDGELTQTGDWLGTLRYSAPEVFSGRHDAKSDVYSWGLSLYELALQRPAFEKGNRAELIKQIVSSSSPLRRIGATEIPAALNSVLLRSTESNPAKRYATAREFSEDLRRFASGDTPLAHRRYQSRGRLRLAATIAAIGVLMAVTSGLIVNSTRGPRQTAPGLPADIEVSLVPIEPENPAERIVPALETGASTAVATVARRFVHAPGVRVRAADLSLDGESLVTGGDDGTIRMWNVKTGALNRTLAEQRGSVRYLRFTPAGRNLVAAHGADPKSTDVTIEIWDFERQIRKEFSMGPGFKGAIPIKLSRLRFFQLQNYAPTIGLLVANGTDAVAWQLQTGGKISVDLNVAPARIECVAAKNGSPGVHSAIVLGDDAGMVHIREMSAGGTSRKTNPDLGRLQGVDFSPDEKVLVCWGERGLALSHLPHTEPAVLSVDEVNSAVQHVAMSSDNKWASVATNTDCRLIELEHLTWKGDPFSLDEPLLLLGWHQSNQSLIMVTNKGRIRHVDARTRTELGPAAIHQRVITDVRWYSEQSRLAVLDETDTVTVYQMTK